MKAYKFFENLVVIAVLIGFVMMGVLAIVVTLCEFDTPGPVSCFNGNFLSFMFIINIILALVVLFILTHRNNIRGSRI